MNDPNGVKASQSKAVVTGPSDGDSRSKAVVTGPPDGDRQPIVFFAPGEVPVWAVWRAPIQEPCLHQPRRPEDGFAGFEELDLLRVLE
jgi:hypothetical protein